MAFYGDEEEMWKCPKHPSKRRPTGVCPSCLRERLLVLFPDCATVRPCSSSSSSGVGTNGRLSNLIDSEPAFRRSKSLAIPFLRSRSGAGSDFGSRKETPPASAGSTRTRYRSLWSILKNEKSKKRDSPAKKKMELDGETDRRQTAVMRRSRSVAISTETMAVEETKPVKGKGWHFPTPNSVFRQAKNVVRVEQRSPMHRG